MKLLRTQAWPCSRHTASGPAEKEPPALASGRLQVLRKPPILTVLESNGTPRCGQAVKVLPCWLLVNSFPSSVNL